MPEVKLIAAIDDANGIAIGQKLPWDLPTDKHYFQEKIKDGPIVMGWNTFAANNFKAFGHGTNTVITRRKIEAVPGVWIAHDIDKFFKNLIEDVWVLGGGQIFKAAMPFATKLYITRVKGCYNANVFFPKFESSFSCVSSGQPQQENGIVFRFEEWELNN
jgi:dihydrofolate reductase